MRNQPAERKYHIIYKTSRLDESGVYYIGMHSTDVLDDRYLGSGVFLTNSIRKYGRSLHRKEILEHLPSRDALVAREAELVNDALLADPKCMNLMCGGGGAGLGEKNPFFGRTHSAESRLKQAAARRGKAITPEVKCKLSRASSAALSKEYLVIAPDGSHHQVKGLKSFCLEHGLVYTTLFATIKKQVPSGGWLVKRH